MSHELRTPLNAVIGFSEVLLDRMFGEINDRQEEYLRDIWTSGKHLLQLLSEILDLSKVEAGQMELDNSTFSVGGALEYSVAMMRERAARRDLTLTLDVDEAVGPLDGDELRFKQVVLNLLSNAVKFTPEGGAISVTAKIDGDVLVVEVTDTGVGIAEDDRDRIFESFQQGPRAAATQEGTGLGLTLCRRIILLMGGEIWLDSRLGVGSTFGFRVPMRARSDDDQRAPVATDPTARPRIVVIEDDNPSADLLMVYLEDAGFEVGLASDGVSGLEKVHVAQPAAVVLDIRLPGLDGWNVLRALKADPDTRGIPVFIVSVVDERHKGLSLGAADYLLKPVNRDDLLTSLTRCGVVSALRASSTKQSGRVR